MSEPMQIPIWLTNFFSSGKITLSVSDEAAVNLKVRDKKIDFEIIDKKIIKDILKTSFGKETLSPMNMLENLENIAETLKSEDLTVTVSYKGGVVLTLGTASASKLSQLVTRTKAIEINNLGKLIQLIV
ncbi:MAG: hypothetical protein ACOC6H_00795 [Thermoproteota archaeon]